MSINTCLSGKTQDVREKFPLENYSMYPGSWI